VQQSILGEGNKPPKEFQAIVPGIYTVGNSSTSQAGKLIIQGGSCLTSRKLLALDGVPLKIKKGQRKKFKLFPWNLTES
jgi:hypothetical protein